MERQQHPGLGDSPLHRYLDGEFWRLKNELRGLLGSCPLFQPRYDLSLDEMRALTVQRVKFTMGLPLLKQAIQEQAEKTRNFVSRSLAIGEVLSTADMATAVKCGIIYWLFGGAVRNLGSPRHVTKWLQPLQEQKYTGMFAMTERGHGSNVRRIQTEATFDLSAQEFVIHTPCEDAMKMYIGNAMHGNYAAVFAQLIVDGRSQGPHCFIVPVRDESGNLYPGVTAIDMMYKEGLHGVDNGILIFDKVRIPRDNLLDKFGSLAPGGQYYSPIEDKSARFNAILAALTPSRLAVTFQAMGAMKPETVWTQGRGGSQDYCTSNADPSADASSGHDLGPDFCQQFYSGIPESLLTAQGEYPAVSGHHCILMVRKLRTSQFLVPDTELLKPF
ncbi:acyl-coenzyme A oxidase-like protein isoform X2 [Pteropus medius]|uniref:acyl-coenzyme A oxidase-like protein isoform X2 n=1 Tax=Pteropus vampyrus TaxID=132908 RepID=UPI00196A8974|nr:acyl-coenzyme A oxidase-like protein isoform X2 [Pteropus giganteus]